MIPKQVTQRNISLRVFEIQTLLDSGSLEDAERQWCELVVANNPPGQLVHADREMIQRCQKQAGAEVSGEAIQGQHEPELASDADSGEGADAS